MATGQKKNGGKEYIFFILEVKHGVAIRKWKRKSKTLCRCT